MQITPAQRELNAILNKVDSITTYIAHFGKVLKL